MLIRSGDRPVHAEQRDRGKPDQMGEAPPADGAKRHVLRPHEKQQQAEDGLDVDRHQKQRVDVEGHSVSQAAWPSELRSPIARIDPSAEKN